MCGDWDGAVVLLFSSGRHRVSINSTLAVKRRWLSAHLRRRPGSTVVTLRPLRHHIWCHLNLLATRPLGTTNTLCEIRLQTRLPVCRMQRNIALYTESHAHIRKQAQSTGEFDCLNPKAVFMLCRTVANVNLSYSPNVSHFLPPNNPALFRESLRRSLWSSSFGQCFKAVFLGTYEYILGAQR